MAEPIGEIPIEISGDWSRLQQDLLKAEALASQAAPKIASAFNFGGVSQSLDTVGNSMLKVGGILTAALTAPAIALASMENDFRKFELAMREVTSLMGGSTVSEFKALSKGVEELSQRLGIDAVKAAKGLYEAISAGVPKDNALTFLEVASKTAIAGVTSTKVAVDGLTTVINSYKLSTAEAKEIADAMFQSVNIGKFTFEQLAASMSKAMPIASQVGVSFKEVLAAAASITKQGTPVAVAMTEISYAMTALIRPTSTMKQLFAEMGVESGRALIAAKGFEGALQAVRDAANGNDETLVKAFRSMQAFRAVMSLTGQNAKEAASDLKQVTESTDAMTKAFDEINKSQSRGFDQLKASMQALGLAIGNELAPAIAQILTHAKPLVDFAVQAVKWFGDLDPVIHQIALGFAAFAVALGPLVVVGGTLAKAAAGFIELSTALSGSAGLASALAKVAPLIIAGGPIVLGIVAVGAAAIATAIQIAELKNRWEDFDRTVRNKNIRDAINAGKTIEDLRKLGFTLDQIKDAVGNTAKQFGEAKQFTNDWGVSVKIGGDSAAAAADKIKALVPAHDGASAATRSHAKALADSVTVLDLTGQAASSLAGYIRVLTVATKEAVSAADLEAIAVEALAIQMDLAGSSTDRAAESAKLLYDVQMNIAASAPIASSGIAQVTADTEEGAIASERYGDSWERTGRRVTSAAQEISNILSRDLGKAIATVIFDINRVGDAFVKIGKDIVSIVVEHIIGKALEPLLASIDKVLAKIPGLGGLFPSASGGVKIPGGGGGGGSSPVNLPEGIGNTPGAGGIPGAGGGGGGGGEDPGSSPFGDLLGGANIVKAVYTLVKDIFFYTQQRRMEQDIGRIEVTTRGILNEALNLRKDLWSQQDNLFYKLDDMWNEIRNVVDILRLIGQSGLGTSTEGGAKSLSELIADVINSRPHSADSSANGPQPLIDAFSTLTTSAHDVSYGLQSITPQIANLSNAVSDTSYAVQEVNRGLPPMVKATEQISAAMDAVTSAHFEMIKKQGGLMGAHSDWINVAPPDPQAAGIMAAWRRIGESFQKSPEGGGTGTFQPYGGATVTVNAVDPSGRQIALATIKGLEEQGIRTR